MSGTETLQLIKKLEGEKNSPLKTQSRKKCTLFSILLHAISTLIDAHVLSHLQLMPKYLSLISHQCYRLNV